MKCDFTNVVKWVTGDRFVGREKTCEDLVRFVQSDLSCAVVGLRRIGKTSVLKAVESRLRKADEDIVISIDMEQYTKDRPLPEARLYVDIVNQIDEALIEKGVYSLGEDKRHSTFYESIIKQESGDVIMDAYVFLTSFLRRQYRQKQVRFVLLLDEFDASVACMGDGLSGFLKRFRTMVDDTPENGFVCVLATSRAIKMLEAKTIGDASTLDGALKSVNVKPISCADFNRLCDISEAPVRAQTRDSYFHQAFGHPFLLGQLLHYHNELYRAKGEEPLSSAVMEMACCEFENYFDELHNVFASFPVPQELASTGINNWFDCLVWREIYYAKIPPHILETFKRYGFWNNGCAMPSVLHEFLARRRIDVWPELKRIEIRLRRWIGSRLREKYGRADWFMVMKLPKHGCKEDPWKRYEKSFQETVDDMRARRQKDLPDILVSHLDCTYLDDLMHLIVLDVHWRDSSNWQGFGRYFDGDIQKFKKMVIDVGNVRNPEAHFVDYPEHLKAKFVEADRYLTNILDQVEKEITIE